MTSRVNYKSEANLREFLELGNRSRSVPNRFELVLVFCLLEEEKMLRHPSIFHVQCVESLSEAPTAYPDGTNCSIKAIETMDGEHKHLVSFYNLRSLYDDNSSGKMHLDIKSLDEPHPRCETSEVHVDEPQYRDWWKVYGCGSSCRYGLHYTFINVDF